MPSKLKTGSPLSYFGADTQVAAALADMLNHCPHVTIPLAGGLGILPWLTASHIVANDINDFAINYFRHASGAMGEQNRRDLARRCCGTLTHPTDLAAANAILDGEWRWSYQHAWAYWALSWLGRKGQCGTRERFKAVSVRRTPSGGGNASRLRAVIDDLSRWATQLARCEFECCCFRDLLAKVPDNVKCAIYCDPPWVGVGNRYLHPFTEQDHIDLAAWLHQFTETTVVVRYGDDPMIRNLYSDWDITEASSRTQANKATPEIWLRNQKDIEPGAS